MMTASRRDSHVAHKTWNTDHSMRISSVVARLRTHASRALHEAGYKTTDGLTRRGFAEQLRAYIRTIERRRDLRLNVKSWIEIAEIQLRIYDKENPS